MARRGISDASDGAFGGNSGIHDAQNLAWKLAMVIRREAGSALPDSYDTERRPLIHGTLAQALARLQKWFKDPAKSLPPQVDLVEGLRGRQVALAQHNAFRSHREHRSRGVGAGLACSAGFAIHPHLEHPSVHPKLKCLAQPCPFGPEPWKSVTPT
ncbi:FAD-dependent monooxygenase [Mesorhizobium sp. M1169]|uniref:FAD-dependent monooxygenase n=1 Tax=Mesorhizobium sp. M1169 TaxID=2957066 RepID=UPI003337778D